MVRFRKQNDSKTIEKQQKNNRKTRPALYPEKSLSNGRNAGNTDKIGISGVALWRLALKWL